MENMLKSQSSRVVNCSLFATGFAVLVVMFGFSGASDGEGRSSNVATPVTPVGVQLTLDDHEDGFDPLPQAIQAATERRGIAGDTRSQQHRKQVFDERHYRLEKGDKRNNRPTEVVDLPKDLSMELL